MSGSSDIRQDALSILRQGALQAAPLLLGWKLVSVSPEGRTAGYIVETEAYTMEDPASHAHGGRRQRNAALFEAAGTMYVYFTYGMHYCFNLVTGPKNHGQGVLVRALEPVEGLEIMKRRRGIDNLRLLTNGPAKITQAMGLGKDLAGKRLFVSSVSLEYGFTPQKIIQTTRVGISKAVDQPWRFYCAGNPFVSKH